jgi:phage recombination protein Bet
MEMTTSALETVNALPEPVVRRGMNEAGWRTLCNNLYPGADPKSVLMVLDYCAARKLDPLKKPCHIVQIDVRNAKTDQYEKRDVVLPGIYELRTTAQRTGVYLGHSAPDYGPIETSSGVAAPAWCAMTFYRWNRDVGVRAEYPVRVLFKEVVALNKERKVNARWSKAPVQMLTKCTEAAGLREAFPDEIGGEQTAEEMDGQRAIDVQTVEQKFVPVAPDGYPEVVADLEAVADEGIDKLEAAFAVLSEAHRTYLTRSDADTWDALKIRALEKGGDR